MYKITIKPVLNGWIVNVGCQTVVFEDKKYMLLELGKYIDDPKATEKRYLKEAVNKNIMGQDSPAPIEREILEEANRGATTQTGSSPTP